MFTIVIADMTDRYYYAHFIDDESLEIYGTADTLEMAKRIANDLFISKNYAWNSLEEMNELDAGHDIWIYDKKSKKVYRAHETYKNKWFK